MGLTMRLRGEVCCPVVLCDYCGLEIRDGRDGHMLWPTNDDGSTGTGLHFVHRNNCDAQFQAREHGAFGWAPLSHLPVYLAANLNVSWVAERRRILEVNGYDADEPRLRLTGTAWNALRAQVFKRDGNICQYCGEYTANPHCDHVIPVSRGGDNGLWNLVTACPRCNGSKHNGRIKAATAGGVK